MTWFEKLMIISVLPTSIIILFFISMLRDRYNGEFNLANALAEKEKDDPGMVTFMIILAVVWPVGFTIILATLFLATIETILNKFFNFSLDNLPEVLVKERKFWWSK